MPGYLDRLYNPIALYRFRDAITDASGNARDLTQHSGTASYASLYPGYQGIEVGSGDELRITAGAFRLATAFSGFCVFIADGLDSDYQILFTQGVPDGDGSTSGNTLWSLAINSTHVRYLHEHGTGVDDSFTRSHAGAISPGTIHSIGFTRSVSGLTVQLYLDGVPLGDAETLGNAPADGSAGVFSIGGAQTGHDPFIGRMSNLALYASQLTADNVWALHKRTIQDIPLLQSLSKGSVSCVALVQVETESETWKWTNAGYPIFGYPAVIKDVGVLGQQIDPWSREFSHAGLDVIFLRDDGDDTRAILAGNSLVGQRVVVKLGTEELTESQFCERFRGRISATRAEEGQITLSAEDASMFARVRTVDHYNCVPGKHPVTVLQELTELAVPAEEINTGGFVDAAETWNPNVAVARGWPTESTGKVDRGLEVGPAIAQPTPIKDLQLELLELTHGVVFTSTTGTVSYKQFDKDEAARRAFGEDDIIGAVETLGSAVHQCNEFTVGFIRADNTRRYNESDKAMDLLLEGGSRRQALLLTSFAFTSYDDEAQTAGDWPGEAGTGVVARSIESPWLNAISIHEQNIPTTDGGGVETVIVYNPTLNGFTRAGSDVLLRINNELCSCTWEGAAGSAEEWAPAELSNGTGDTLREEWSLDERGLYGTTPDTYEPSGGGAITGGNPITTNAVPSRTLPVVDYTLAVAAANTRVERFRRGIAILRFKVPLWNLDLEFGDTITVLDDVPAMFGFDSSTPYEIVGREEIWFGDQPCLQLTVAAKKHIAPSSLQGRVNEAVSDPQLIREQLRRLDVSNHIKNGGVATSSSGLTAAVSGGDAQVGDRFLSWPDFERELTANRDTYLSLDIPTGGIIRRELSVGADAPTFTTRELSLAKLRTDASSITAITDLRWLYPMTGGLIEPGTVGDATIADHSVGWLQLDTTITAPAATNALQVAGTSGTSIGLLVGSGLTYGVSSPSTPSIFSSIYLGPAELSTSPSPGTIAGTKASGTDVDSADSYLDGGRGTGSGRGGSWVIRTAPASVFSGTSLNNLATRLTVDQAGDVYLGNGITAGSPTAGKLRAAGGSGSNVAGASLTLAGGAGTGTGVGGSILLQVAAAGSSGSSPNSLATAVTIASDSSATFAGNLSIAATGTLRLAERTAPSSAANTGQVYTKDVSARTELYYMDDTGAEVKLTTGGKLNTVSITVATISFADNTANAFVIREGSDNSYFACTSTDGAETIDIGNAGLSNLVVNVRAASMKLLTNLVPDVTATRTIGTRALRFAGVYTTGAMVGDLDLVAPDGRAPAWIKLVERPGGRLQKLDMLTGRASWLLDEQCAWPADIEWPPKESK